MHILNPIPKVLLAALLGTGVITAPLAAGTPAASDWTGVKAAGWVVGGTVLPIVLGTVLLAAPGAGDADGAGLVILSAGMIAGPAMGQYYAGSPIQAKVGLHSHLGPLRGWTLPVRRPSLAAVLTPRLLSFSPQNPDFANISGPKPASERRFD